VGVAALTMAAAASLGIGSCGDVPNAGRVVATVNGKPITYGELVRELERTRGASVLLDLLDESLVLAEAEKRKLTLTQQEKDGGLERAAARVGSMRDLEMQLQRRGIPMDAYRRQIETDLLLDKIALQEAKVPDQEAAAYYDAHRDEFKRGARVKARMMLFRDKSSAEAVLDALKEPGADFAGLASSLSEDDATKANGGDMGYFERNDYAPAISDAAFKLKPGQISGLIQGPDGWVVLKVEGRKPAGPLAFAEVKEQIRQRLIHDKQQQVRDQWLLAARKKARLTIGDKDLQEAVAAIMGTIKPPPMPGQL
jgi:foldase protein PrsA